MRREERKTERDKTRDRLYRLEERRSYTELREAQRLERLAESREECLDDDRLTRRRSLSSMLERLARR